MSNERRRRTEEKKIPEINDRTRTVLISLIESTAYKTYIDDTEMLHLPPPSSSSLSLLRFSNSLTTQATCHAYVLHQDSSIVNDEG